MLLEINCGQLYYEFGGNLTHLDKGKPVVFVLPGGPGLDHSGYKKNLHILEDELQIVYLDPRGCGQSNVSDISSCTMSNYITDVELLRKHLNLDKICILGVSYGSMTAIGYAVSYASHISKLLLSGGASSHRFSIDAKRNLAIRGTKEQKEICEHLWNGSFENKAHVQRFFEITRSLYSNKARDGLAEPLAPNYSDCCSTEVINLGFKTFMRTFDFEPGLNKISCETLIFSGKNDWINDPHQAEILVKNIPGSHLITFDSGHSIALDQHAEYIKYVREFFLRN